MRKAFHALQNARRYACIQWWDNFFLEIYLEFKITSRGVRIVFFLDVDLKNDWHLFF